MPTDGMSDRRIDLDWLNLVVFSTPNTHNGVDDQIDRCQQKLSLFKRTIKIPSVFPKSHKCQAMTQQTTIQGMRTIYLSITNFDLVPRQHDIIIATPLAQHFAFNHSSHLHDVQHFSQSLQLEF